jgi:hypothetical protein
MANCAGIPPGNEGEDVQLFTRSGDYVTTVAIPNYNPEVIMWGSRFFHRDGGRFVEASAFTSIEVPR